jgi:predicted PurR-regulated permease PerM
MATPTLTTPSPSRISFPSGERIAIGIALALTLYAAYVTVRPVLLVVVFAAALASLTFGLFTRLLRASRNRRRTAATLTVLIVLIGGLAPLAGLATLVVRQLVIEVTVLSTEVKQEGPGTVERLTHHLGPAGPSVNRAIQQLRPKLAAAAPQVAQRAATMLAAFGSALVQIGIGVFLLALSLYYFLLQGPVWKARLVRLLPLQAVDVNMFLERFHQVSVGVIVGNLGTALAQGAIASGGYFLFGAPVPLIWGLATAVAALIPAVGTVLVWLPLSIIVGLQHGWWRGAGLALFGALVVSTIDNVVRPLLTKRGLNIHPLLIFIAIFGGVAAYGVAGIFVGPLVIALAITVLDLYERRIRPPKPA